MAVVTIEAGKTLGARSQFFDPRHSIFVVLDPGINGDDGNPFCAVRWDIRRRILADPGDTYTMDKFLGLLNQRWGRTDLTSWLDASVRAGSIKDGDRTRVLRWFEEGITRPPRTILVPSDFIFANTEPARTP